MYIQEIENKTIYTSKLPKPFKNYLNGLEGQSEDIKNAHGYFKLSEPTILPTQRKGALKKVDNYYTYEVIDKTPEEIQAEEEAQKKATRNELLTAGVVVEGVWFNEVYLGQFIASVQTDEKAGAETTLWKNDANEWQQFTILEAYNLAKKAKDKLQEFYINY